MGECTGCTSLTRPRAGPGKRCATPGYGGWGGEGGSLPGQPATWALCKTSQRGEDPQGAHSRSWACQSTGFLDFEADL